MGLSVGRIALCNFKSVVVYVASLALALVGTVFIAPQFLGQVAHAVSSWSVDASRQDDTQCISPTFQCKTIQAAVDAASAGDTILISGTFGSIDAYTIYSVNQPITIRGVNTGNVKAKVYGTFLLYVDGVTIDNLSITNKGISHPDKNAINLLGKQVTITNNDFSLGNGTGGVANGVVIWPYGSNAVSLNITGNTFTGYSLTVPGWSSTALFVAEEINATPFTGTPMSTTLVVPNEESFANGNTYINNSYDYVHQNWGSGGGDWSYSRVSNSDGLSDAIANSATGATILVASGEYTTTGQVVISKNLSIVGADKATTIIKTNEDTSNSGDTRGWFLVQPGNTFNISNVTLDGTGHMIYMGLYYWGNGTVNNVNITNIKYNQSGPDYQGRGMIIKGNVNVTNSTFTEMGRIAIQYYGGSGTASGNTMIGKGAGNWLDYGFDIGAGAVVNVLNNTISGDTGTGGGEASAAVMATTYFGGGTQATVTGNILTNNSIGIAAGYDGTDTAVVVAHNNNISGNTNGLVSTNLTVDATNNWWGSPDPDFGSIISGAATYDPYYINPGKTQTNTQAADALVAVKVTAAGKVQASYTIVSWATLTDALGLAETTNALIVAKTVAISDAIGALVYKANLTDYNVALTAVTEVDYTPGSWATYQIVVLANAKTTEDTQAAVDTATSNITEAQGSLVGVVTVNPDTPGVVLTNPNQAVDITIANGTNTPTIDVSAFITDGTGVLPEITINSEVADVVIPNGTIVTGPAGWDGIIDAPTAGTSDGENAPAGFSVGGTVISIGSADGTLWFNTAVSIVLPGVTGAVGYRPALSSTWQTIDTECTSATDHSNISSGECYFHDNGNTIIWTYHFTSFGELLAVVVPVVPITPATPVVTTTSPESETYYDNSSQVGTDNSLGSQATLGSQTTNDKTADYLANPAVLATTDNGWSIFGLAWYWWLIIVAVVTGLVWWIIAGMRRDQA